MIYFYYYSYYLQLPPLALESGFFPATLCSPAALFRPWSLTVFSFLWLGLVQSRMHLGPYLHHNPQDVQIVAIKDVHQLPYVFAMKKKNKKQKTYKKKKANHKWTYSNVYAGLCMYTRCFLSILTVSCVRKPALIDSTAYMPSSHCPFSQISLLRSDIKKKSSKPSLILVIIFFFFLKNLVIFEPLFKA